MYENDMSESFGDSHMCVSVKYKDSKDYYDKRESFKDVARSLKVTKDYHIPEGAIFIHVNIDDEYEI